MMFGQGRSFSGHERHCIYLNTGGPRFANVSVVSGLDHPDDGRAVALADWDQDGDLDLWIANRTAPRLRFMRNDAGRAGHYVAIRLRGDGVKSNRDAIGARVEVVTNEDEGHRRIKTLRAGEGFLAQSSKWLHFGLGRETAIEKAVVMWPNGVREEFTGLTVNKRFLLVQGAGVVRPVEARAHEVSFTPSVPEVPRGTDQARIPLVHLLPFPRLEFRDGKTVKRTGDGTPTLLLLWTSWCPHCRAELKELTERHAELEAAGVRVVALCVNGIGNDRTDPEDAARVIEELKGPILFGRANQSLVAQLQLHLDSLVLIKRRLPVPCSFLIDGEGRLAVVYKGPVGVDTVLGDLTHADGSATKRVHRAAFLPGRTIDDPHLASVRRRAGVMTRFPLAISLVKLGVKREAVEHLLALLEIDPSYADAHYALGNLYAEAGRVSQAISRYERALELKPNFPEARYNLGVGQVALKKYDLARASFERTLELRPGFVGADMNLGKLAQRRGELREAESRYRRVLAARWDHEAANNLSWILATRGSASPAEKKEALELAEKLAKQCDYGVPMVLDTLAAAHAQNGDFEAAAKWQAKAVALAKDRKPQYERHLERYKAKQPWRGD